MIRQKTWRQGAELIFPIYLYRKLWKSSCQKPLDWFQFYLAGMFLWWPSTKIVQDVMICHMAARGRGLFSLYIYIEKKKIFLSITTGPISILLGSSVSLVTLYQDCPSRHDWSKTRPLGGRAYFPNISKLKTQKIIFSETTGPISI